MQVTLRCPKDSAGFLVHFQSHHRLRELPELRVLCHWRWLELTDSALLCTFDLDQVPHGVTRKRSSITKAWVTRTWGFEDSWLTRRLDDSTTFHTLQHPNQSYNSGILRFGGVRLRPDLPKNPLTWDAPSLSEPRGMPHKRYWKCSRCPHKAAVYLFSDSANTKHRCLRSKNHLGKCWWSEACWWSLLQNRARNVQGEHLSTLRLGAPSPSNVPWHGK